MPNARMAVVAAEEALKEAGLPFEELRNRKAAIILGCAGSSYEHIYDGAFAFRETGKVKRVSPFTVPRVMASSAVSNLAILLGVDGETYDISSACTSGTHSIIVASRLLQLGLYEYVITGGTEETNWVHALGFDAMRALSRKYNDTPHKASRPFDRDRDGFVIGTGAGILILETEEHAKRRGAPVIAVLSGSAANTNPAEMVVPSSQSSCDVMRLSIENAGLCLDDIGYINTHGTSTPTGDSLELEAIRLLFGGKVGNVAINSTKSMTGHMIGATGAVEAVFCTQMIQKKFICPSINIENIEPGFEWADIVRECRTGVSLRHTLSNSFGFGGTNACLVISAP
jgi:3-oxoacyl-[acyl-carrier-protein] synthase-1